MMALPSAGFPPQVHVITCLTLFSDASSSTGAVNALSTSPVTASFHSSGFATTRSSVAPHSADVALWNTSLMTLFSVSSVWSYENVPAAADALTSGEATAVPAGASTAGAGEAPWSDAGAPSTAKAVPAPLSVKEAIIVPASRPFL